MTDRRFLADAVSTYGPRRAVVVVTAPRQHALAGVEIAALVGAAVVVIVTLVGHAHAAPIHALLARQAVLVPAAHRREALALLTSKPREALVVVSAPVFTGESGQVAALARRTIGVLLTSVGRVDALPSNAEPTRSAVVVIIAAGQADPIEADLPVVAVVVAEAPFGARHAGVVYATLSVGAVPIASALWGGLKALAVFADLSGGALRVDLAALIPHAEPELAHPTRGAVVVPFALGGRHR